MATELLDKDYIQDYSFVPSEKEQNVVKDTFEKFKWSQDQRNSGFEYFDGRTLIDYINDSVRRFTTNVDEREGLEDWQARVFDPFTRNKVLAILGKIISVLPIATIAPRGDEDIRKSQVLNDLYQYSEDVSDYEEFMINYLLEAIVKGTAIGYEGMLYDERHVRDVKGSGDKLTVSDNVIRETKLYAELVPLENFYPSDVGIRTIKEMPYCFWREEISYPKFCQQWNAYSKYKIVKPHAPLTQWPEQRPFYIDYISKNIEPGNVEVIRYYDKQNDMYIVLANGIWLNPLSNEEISPLPFNHKELPFFDVKFDFLGNWFYGKSLPDRLKSLQDVLNVLTNMLLDQSFLTIFPPILTAGADSIEDDYLRPGRRTPVDTQGLPINQAFQQLDMGVPSGWHQFILEYTRKVMEESSIDRVSSGAAGVGGRTTAQEIRVAAEGVASMLGIFGRLINFALKRKVILRGGNILQFWTDKNSPMVKGVLGDDGDELLSKAFNLVKVDNTVLSSGKRGTRVIAMYADEKDMPKPQELLAKEVAAKTLNNKNVDYIAIQPEYLRNMQFDIKMIMDVKKDQTRDIEKALQLEKVRVYAGLFPQGTFNMDELAAQTAEKMGDDPTKILNPDKVQTLMEQAGLSEAAQPASNKPQANLSQNMTDLGTQGVDGGLQDLKSLAGGMM